MKVAFNKSNHLSLIFLLLGLGASSVTIANDQEVIEQHKKMLLEKFPEAEFTEVEIENYKGQEVFEYEFVFHDEDYEAYVTRSGKILRLSLD